MGTKLNPGKYDCYANAKEDEPMFVLLARDVLAPHLVLIWAFIKSGNMIAARHAVCAAIEAYRASGKSFKEGSDPKLLEAIGCAANMEKWRKYKKNLMKQRKEMTMEKKQDEPMFVFFSLPVEVSEECSNSLAICDASGDILFERVVEGNVSDFDRALMERVASILNDTLTQPGGFSTVQQDT